MALDKSEGAVKEKLFRAMRKHRNVGQTSLCRKERRKMSALAAAAYFLSLRLRLHGPRSRPILARMGRAPAYGSEEESLSCALRHDFAARQFAALMSGLTR